MLIHVVQRGESVWQIAQRYRVSPDAIVRANQLPNPDRLVIGQALVIPVPDRHVVQPGESLWSIAQRYGITVEALARANRIADPARIFPGQVLVIPERPKPTIEVNAFLEIMGTRGQQIVREVGAALTYLSPFSYQVRADGSLNPLPDEAVLATAQEQRVAPLMVITNFADGRFRSDIARAVFTDPAAQERLLAGVLNTMRAKGYRGLIINFEYVYPEDRQRYNQFLRRVTERLRPEGYLVSSALAPKTRADQPGLLYEAHDYPAHGALLDFVILMTYEWGWSGGPPMAVAPVDQVRRVLDYAVTAIPRGKILMGMPLYGYDWTLPYVRGGPFAQSISPQEAIQRAARYGATIQYDPQAQAPFFRYVDAQGRRHEVWFEDARSVQAKFNLVKAYRLRGISYWVLGHAFPQNWLLLLDNFRVQKR
ncbi:glycoside hydrolase family 18 protein [Calditerricola satsumensis]|uniref:Germination protein n=1 Tax=Calditerricola satsumensis TaxID=373054 RepID=A0A8J3F984_9BACI|nr:glycoside hydrolase family 18 protein [Calditerricola satsumensis]GGJ92633.1 germination protein [Calditerricola satsumensis]